MLRPRRLPYGSPKWTPSLLATLVLLGASFLMSCSMGQKVRSAFGGQLPVEIRIAPDANDDTPIAVDLVAVYDGELLDALLKLPAAEWFKKRKQFVLDHDRAIEVRSWEWVPGQTVETITVEYRAGCKKILVFADYHTEGEHRASLAPQQPSRVVFKDRDFNVEAQQ